MKGFTPNKDAYSLHQEAETRRSRNTQREIRRTASEMCDRPLTMISTKGLSKSEDECTEAEIFENMSRAYAEICSDAPWVAIYTEKEFPIPTRSGSQRA